MIGVDIVLYGLLAAWLDNIIPTGKYSEPGFSFVISLAMKQRICNPYSLCCGYGSASGSVSLKNDVNVPSFRIRICIRIKMSRIRNTGYSRIERKACAYRQERLYQLIEAGEGGGRVSITVNV
jgi:hypothetical protein